MTKIDEEEIAKTSDEIINKIEKFFMTGKGMLYDVHFWKNDICNATELICHFTNVIPVATPF